VLQEGCAFEELISFHGGLGGPQTRPFVLHPLELHAPEQPIIGCAALHEVLAGWRTALQPGVVGLGGPARASHPDGSPVRSAAARPASRGRRREPRPKQLIKQIHGDFSEAEREVTEAIKQSDWRTATSRIR